MNDVSSYGSLELAYLGDCVYELAVRERLLAAGPSKTQILNRSALRYVTAKAQSVAAEALHPYLTPEEEDIFRRGRNTRPHSLNKHSSLAEYRQATALEALLGYLWLSGNTERVQELCGYCFSILDAAEEKKPVVETK